MSINTHYTQPPLPNYYPSQQANSDRTTSAPVHNRNKRGSASTKKLWPQNSVIKIGLVGMSKDQEKLVKDSINKWQPYVNLKFEFTAKPEEATVRVQMDSTLPKGEGWAWIGTDSTKYPDNTAHVTISSNGSSEEIESAALHEWGHVLGLEHEHERAHIIQKPHPDKEGLTLNLDGSLISGPLDENSVMYYKFTYNEKGEKEFAVQEISEEDKKFVSTLYPPTRKFRPFLSQTSETLKKETAK